MDAPSGKTTAPCGGALLVASPLQVRASPRVRTVAAAFGPTTIEPPPTFHGVALRQKTAPQPVSDRCSALERLGPVWGGGWVAFVPPPSVGASGVQASMIKRKDGVIASHHTQGENRLSCALASPPARTVTTRGVAPGVFGSVSGAVVSLYGRRPGLQWRRTLGGGRVRRSAGVPGLLPTKNPPWTLQS